MIDFYYWTTPNGHKVTLFLEETGLDYNIIPVNIGEGDQFKADFLAIAPNNRIPAIVDHEPLGGGAPLSLFESGAILEYLADKTGQFLAASGAERYQTLQWLHWQMGGLGPMLGQNHHFNRYAPEKVPYAQERYINESRRLYGVLEKQLAGRDFIVGDQYTIADMASFPWTMYYEYQSIDIDDYPNIKAWMARINDRPATQRAYAIIPDINPNAGQHMTEEQKAQLYGRKY